MWSGELYPLPATAARRQRPRRQTGARRVGIHRSRLAATSIFSRTGSLKLVLPLLLLLLAEKAGGGGPPGPCTDAARPFPPYPSTHSLLYSYYEMLPLLLILLSSPLPQCQLVGLFFFFSVQSRINFTFHLHLCEGLDFL